MTSRKYEELAHYEQCFVRGLFFVANKKGVEAHHKYTARYWLFQLISGSTERQALGGVVDGIVRNGAGRGPSLFIGADRETGEEYYELKYDMPPPLWSRAMAVAILLDGGLWSEISYDKKTGQFSIETESNDPDKWRGLEIDESVGLQ